MPARAKLSERVRTAQLTSLPATRAAQHLRAAVASIGLLSACLRTAPRQDGHYQGRTADQGRANSRAQRGRFVSARIAGYQWILAFGYRGGGLLAARPQMDAITGGDVGARAGLRRPRQSV